MRVLDWQEFIEGGEQEKATMTIGVFDGVHRGHQALIAKIVSRGPCPTVITFKQNPKWVLSPQTYEGDIFSLDQKLAAFEQLGISRTVLIDFSGNFSKLRGREFIGLLMDRGNLSYLAIGSNFHCGYGLDTDALGIRAMTEERGILTEVVSPVFDGADPVSSSRIRASISAGDFTGAGAALGRNVEIDLGGIFVSTGAGVLVFDTALARRIIPPDGWYEVVVHEMNRINTIEGKKTEIFIKDRKLGIPSSFNTVQRMRVEFLARYVPD
ncbi:MAG: riboflavin biosynthesis protein RibF [Treponema sp.]|jgi:riboflavin kinase/FMN adenylyltransferase|nr:riboflavin biosynthesis protein RibF [Treponema sp.]